MSSRCHARAIAGIEVAFLPAALEIIETPPSPLGRAIAVTIAGVFCLALAWASLGRIDIVASAPGKIIPSVSLRILSPAKSARSIADGRHIGARDWRVKSSKRSYFATVMEKACQKCWWNFAG